MVLVFYQQSIHKTNGGGAFIHKKAKRRHYVILTLFFPLNRLHFRPLNHFTQWMELGTITILLPVLKEF